MNQSTLPTPSPAFSVPFTLAQVQHDLTTVFLHQLRSLALFVGEESIATMVGKCKISERGLWDTTQDIEDYDLSPTDLANSGVMHALEVQYKFGFMGLDLPARAFMERDSVHSYTAALLLDLRSSSLADEFESGDLQVSRCLHTCEIANARQVLEGGGQFFPYFADSAETATDVEGALTVHQIALLSGMEEMSVRTAISRKGPNQLPAFKEGRSTLIRIADAKDWLKAKGLYVPLVTRADIGRDLDLRKTSFRSAAELIEAVNARGDFLAQMAGRETLRKQIAEVNGRIGLTDPYDLPAEALLNAEFMRALAEVLDWPPALLVLRAKEAVLHQELRDTSARTAALLRDTE